MRQFQKKEEKMDNIQEGEVVEEESTQGLTPTLTPEPRVENKAVTMSFLAAMQEIINGQKVTRMSWSNGDYCLLKDGWLTIFTKGAFHTWSISDGDMEGQDWIIVKELNAQTNWSIGCDP